MQRLGQWAISLGVVSVMTLTGATLCYLWLRRFTDWNKPTCYFAAMPGGLNDMTLLGGAMGETVLDTSAVQALAELPSLDELRAILIGLLQAPATKIARVLKEPGAQIARVLQAQSAKAT